MYFPDYNSTIVFGLSICCIFSPEILLYLVCIKIKEMPMNASADALIIADMTEQTVEAVAALEKLCFSSPWSSDSLRTELMNPLAVFRTASTGGVVVGYVGMHHVVDEGYITNVAVNPDYRRCGIARALMDSLLDYGKANGLCSVTLEVRESNEAARALYRGLRFEDVGRRKAFYTQPTEDAVLMTYKY